MNPLLGSCIDDTAVEVRYTYWSLPGVDTATEWRASPVEVQKVHRQDHSGSITVRDSLGGLLLQTRDYAIGHFPLVFGCEPPREVAELGEYLRSRSRQSLIRTEDYLDAVIDLRSEWPLSDAQSTALVQLLAGLSGVSLGGLVDDRLGRTGLVLSTSTRRDGRYQDLFVFDEQSGQLLEAETVYLEGLRGSRVPTNTVVSYIAWR